MPCPCASVLALLLSLAVLSAQAEPQRFVRFQKGATVAYGQLEGDRVLEISGDLFGTWQKTAVRHALSEVRLLPPTQPSKVLALAGNYRSHFRTGTAPATAPIPQPFLKPTSCLVGQGAAIVLPKDAQDVHFEGELVIVIGRTCRRVSKEQALSYVFGVTAGNDISERIWQNDPATKDIQWWRAKGADTFGPVGPCIVTGVDYGNLMLRLRVNGEVKQEESTRQLINDIPTIVSFISRYVTLLPGDLIFTGTSGKTSPLKPGDVVEVDLEQVGVLRNPVESEK